MCPEYLGTTTTTEEANWAGYLFESEVSTASPRSGKTVEISDLVTGEKLNLDRLFRPSKHTGRKSVRRKCADSLMIAMALSLSQSTSFGVTTQSDEETLLHVATSNDHDQEHEWNKAFEKLEALQTLEDGWNSHTAPAPTEDSIEIAGTFLETMKNLDCMSTRIAPSAVGGIAITIRKGDRKVCVEFFNYKRISALFADDESQLMHTQAVEGSIPGFKTLVKDIGIYLNATSAG